MSPESLLKKSKPKQQEYTLCNSSGVEDYVAATREKNTAIVALEDAVAAEERMSQWRRRHY